MNLSDRRFLLTFIGIIKQNRIIGKKNYFDLDLADASENMVDLSWRFLKKINEIISIIAFIKIYKWWSIF
jgi:hypothetical protein